jgi:hypothetical protein
MIILKRLFPFLSFFTFIFFVTLNCDDSITNEDVDNMKIPLSNVSFAEHIYPIFQVKCMRCHNATDPDGNLDLTTYASATSDLNVIFPGDTSNSKLVWAIQGLSGIEPMPPIGYPVLKPFHINGIKTWIAEGARNN